MDMSSEAKSTKSDDDDFSCGLLLRDIEDISKALYLHKNPREAFNAYNGHRQSVVAKTAISEPKPDVVIQDLSSHKDKKSSIWKWRPLKALTHIRNHRCNCCFYLHVHAIEGLPSNFNNLNMCVTWKRKSGMLRTHPAQVRFGMAEFEETLMHRCAVFVGRSGANTSAKYKPKLFLLQASVVGAPVLDIGSHWIDLSRLLPLSLQELEGDKSSSGKWTTSFKLTGRAKGATLNVSFGFSVSNSNSFEPGYFLKVPNIVRESSLNHFTDFGTSSRRRSNQLNNCGSIRGISSGGSANLNFIKEIHPEQRSELSKPASLLYELFDDASMGNAVEFDLRHDHLESVKLKPDPMPEYSGGETGHEFHDTGSNAIEQGIDGPVKGQIKQGRINSQRFGYPVIETIDVADIFAGEETEFDDYAEWSSKLDADLHDEPECSRDDPKDRDNGTCILEPDFEELDSEISDLFTPKQAEMDTVGLDDGALADSIENDFLIMLGIGQSEDDIVSGSDLSAPSDLRRLLEEDSLALGNPILDSDMMAEQKESCRFNRKLAFVDDFDLSIGIQAVERNLGRLNQSFWDKRNAEILENLETEALMHEWGLTETAFQYSPRVSSGGFGSPVYVPEHEPLQLPSIEEGLGSIVQTTGGGFLRSMNPLLFGNANNGARLIVQVSAPVVLPTAMGPTVMEKLQCWASVGVQKMCIQANGLMPLEDVTGKTIRQVLAEAESGSDRLDLEQESDNSVESIDEKIPVEHNTLCSCSSCEDIDSNYVPLKDLVPMAITNIEGLLVEGLKIQSGMPGQEPPSTIRIQLGANAAKASELSSNFLSERDSSLQVLDVDELIKYYLSLEEWVRLDSGEVTVEGENRENVSKLLSAHCAEPAESELAREYESVELLGKSGGVFADNFTMGLRVQLRDPLRNHETVGSSMLALVEVERGYSAKQPEAAQNEHIIQGVGSDQCKRNIYKPMFKVSEAHLAGLNVVRGDKPLWGTSRQQQSGSRWLLSSGIAKPNKNLIPNSGAVIKSSAGSMRKALPEDVLWSISLLVEGEAGTWNDQVALNVHVRNPDIIFPTESGN